MTRLRDWPARRIRRLWLAGCVLEVLLFAALMSTGEPPPPRPDWRLSEADSAMMADTTPSVDVETALAQLGFTVTREPLPSGGTQMRISRDSSCVVANVTGDTTTVVAASPDVERAFGTITEMLVAMGAGIAKLVLIAAAVLLPVPILLISITLVWSIQRRRYQT